MQRLFLLGSVDLNKVLFHQLERNIIFLIALWFHEGNLYLNRDSNVKSFTWDFATGIM